MTVVFAVASGIVIIAILHDAFEVMLLPRRVKSKLRIVRYFFRYSWALWSAAARRIASEDLRQNLLSLYGPISLVVLLVFWAIGLIVAFASLYWSLDGRVTSNAWLNHAYFSGVTFFTLGYGDIVPHSGWSKVFAVSEAGTGLGFIAMVIGYLPVMYQIFSRREARVITLDAIAGSPPTAATILSRYADGESLEKLDDFLVDWQQWCAELLESQLSYPMLAYYRSQHDNQSWLAALTTIMDVSVLIMVGFDGIKTFQARLTFATGRLAIIEMGRALGVGPRTLKEDRLPSEAFVRLRKSLVEAGVSFVDEAESEQLLSSFRSTYEPFLNGLAFHLLLVPPAWSPDPDQVDNWVRSPRGKSAKRLFDSVDSNPGPDPPISPDESPSQ